MNMGQLLSISKSGLTGYQNYLDVISNNIANVDTKGFKDKRVAFQELLNNGTYENEVGLSDNAQPLAMNTGVNIQQVNENEAQGALQEAAGVYNVAIEGDGYFGVRDANNNLYLTRDGSFYRDSQGNLVNQNGYQVDVQSQLPASQWPTTGAVSISQQGYVSIGNTRVGRILMYRPENSIDMNAVGNNLYQCTGNLISSANTNNGFGIIHQGMLENSNVDMADSMSNLIITQRAYQLNARALQTTDEMMETINKFTE